MTFRTTIEKYLIEASVDEGYGADEVVKNWGLLCHRCHSLSHHQQICACQWGGIS